MTDQSSFPGPPPSVRGQFVPALDTSSEYVNKHVNRTARRAITEILRLYLESLKRVGKPFPGWETFERELAEQFAWLLLFLFDLPRDTLRKKLLELFLENLNLAGQKGRPRKSKQKLAFLFHGRKMADLWESELLETWNTKRSLEWSGGDLKTRLVKTGFADDVVLVVLSRRATPESSLAKLYARRNHVSEGRARNALREYQKFTDKKFQPSV